MLNFKLTLIIMLLVVSVQRVGDVYYNTLTLQCTNFAYKPCQNNPIRVNAFNYQARIIIKKNLHHYKTKVRIKTVEAGSLYFVS